MKSNLSLLRKLLIAMVIGGAAWYLGVHTTQPTMATACIQDCEADEAMCQDQCSQSCGSESDDATCGTCLASCAGPFSLCMSHAEWCESGGQSYEQQCTVHFGQHCPIINGTTNCNSGQGEHNGDYLICDMGGYSCVSCPDHEYCTGSNGLPPCF